MSNHDDIHIHVHMPPVGLDPRIDDALAALARLEMGGIAMSEAVANLEQKLAEASSIEERQSAVIDALVGRINSQSGQLRDLAQQLADQGVDAEALTALAAEWDQKNADALSQLAQAEALAGAGTESGVEETPAPVVAPDSPAAEAGATEGGLVDAGSSADIPSVATTGDAPVVEEDGDDVAGEDVPAEDAAPAEGSAGE